MPSKRTAKRRAQRRRRAQPRSVSGKTFDLLGWVVAEELQRLADNLKLARLFSRQVR